MASISVIGAVIERYETFTINSTAKIYFDEAPTRDGSGVAIVPPYVVLRDGGTSPDYAFERSCVIENTTLTFEIYATGLASADAIASAIRYNGGAIDAGSGMDFATTLPLTGQTLLQMVRTSEQRNVEGGRGVDATDVYKVTMTYVVQTQRTA